VVFKYRQRGSNAVRLDPDRGGNPCGALAVLIRYRVR
jgi:hypothetical protein